MPVTGVQTCALPISVALLFGLLACDPKAPSDLTGNSAILDTQLRQELGGWGAVPIGAVATQDQNLVDLGRALFFDKELSGNRDVACASCHDMTLSAIDGMSLAVGTGGSGVGASRTLGSGRQFVSRNAASMLNAGIGLTYSLWDGRVNLEGGPSVRSERCPTVRIAA